MQVIRKSGPRDLTQNIDLLMGLEAACIMGESEIEIDDHYYRWENGALYIRMSHHWIEFPCIRKRNILLEETHLDNVHIGIKKMVAKLQEQYYWPTIEEDCTAYVERCLACQL